MLVNSNICIIRVELCNNTSVLNFTNFHSFGLLCFHLLPCLLCYFCLLKIYFCISFSVPKSHYLLYLQRFIYFQATVQSNWANVQFNPDEFKPIQCSIEFNRMLKQKVRGYFIAAPRVSWCLVNCLIIKWIQIR